MIKFVCMYYVKLLGDHLRQILRVDKTGVLRPGH